LEVAQIAAKALNGYIMLGKQLGNYYNMWLMINVGSLQVGGGQKPIRLQEHQP
jgi:hypothetical protein